LMQRWKVRTPIFLGMAQAQGRTSRSAGSATAGAALA
jgi:hypothetical protein